MKLKFFLSLCTAAAAIFLLSAVSANAQTVLFTTGSTPAGSAAMQADNYAGEVQNFTLTGTSTITGVDYGGWTDLGATMTSVEWGIGPGPFAPVPIDGGTNYAPFINSATFTGFSPVVDTFVRNSTTGSTLAVGEDAFSTTPITLGAGKYFLYIDGTASDGGQANWDESGSGTGGYYQVNNPYPYTYLIGSTSSMQFSILGTHGAVITPEPSSLLALGIGCIGLFGFAFLKTRKANAYTIG